jgi:YggT family protein
VSGSPIQDALVFLINTVFGIYILFVVLRFLLAWVRADFYNPISQAIVKITNPALLPLRRLIPGYGGVDWSSVVLMLLLKIVELELVGLVIFGKLLAPAGVLVIAVAELLRLTIYIFMFAVFVQVVLSWVTPGAYNPFTVILYRLTEPLLRPARQLLPPIGGFDFSPVVVLVLLNLTIILIINPLLGVGGRLV